MPIVCALFVLGACAFGAVAGGPAPVVLHVDDDAAPGGDGSSWATAFSDLQDALDAAKGGEEIWVAQGVYTPPLDPKFPQGSSFNALREVHIYGGFVGFESSLEERDFRSYETVLSGFLPDTNSLRVIVFDYESMGSTLDGVTVTGGNSQGFRGGAFGGAGVYVDADGFTMRNCTIVDNHAFGYGGGVFVEDRDVVIESCRFMGNSSNLRGGALAISGGKIGSLVVVNSEFVSNGSDQRGSALYAEFVPSTVVNSSFGLNTNGTMGSGALDFNFAGVDLRNIVVWGNTNQSPMNAGAQISGFLGGGSISHAIVEDYFSGGVSESFGSQTSVSAADPLFLDPDGPDDIAGTADDSLRVRVDSPAVDSGVFVSDVNPFQPGNQDLPLEDVTGLQRIDDGDLDETFAIDRGAHEISSVEQFVWVGGAGISGGAGGNWLGGLAPDAVERRALFTGSGFTTIEFGANEGIDGFSLMTFLGDGTWELIQDGAFDLAPFGGGFPFPGGRGLLAYNNSHVILRSFVNAEGFVMGSATVGGGYGESTLQFSNSEWGGESLFVGRGTDGVVRVDSDAEVGVFGTSEFGSFGGRGELAVDGFMTLANGDTVFGRNGGTGVLSVNVKSTLITGGEGLLVFGSESFGGLQDRGGFLTRGEMHVVGSSWNVSDSQIVFGDGGQALLRIGNGGDVIVDSPFGGLVFAAADGPEVELVIEEGGELSFEQGFGPSLPTSFGPERRIAVTVDGELRSDSPITLGPGSLLQGTGEVRIEFGRGSFGISNYGRFAPGSIGEFGTLSIVGDYTQARLPGESIADSGSLYVDVGNFDSDLLAIDGAAFLSGGLFVSGVGTSDGKVFSPFDPIPGAGSERVILEANGISGEFSVAFLPGFGDGRVAKIRYETVGRGVEQVVYSVELVSQTNDLMGAMGLMTPGEPRDAVLADFDGDGDLDLAVTLPDQMDPDGAPGRIGIYENLGVGMGGEWLGFDEMGGQFVPIGVSPRGITAADLDEDGDIDIAAVSTGDNSVWTLVNDSMGGFSAEPPIVGFMLSPRDIAAGDLDGDGDVDLAVTGVIPATMMGGVGVLVNTELRTAFGPGGTFQFGARPDDIDIDDVDNDKDLDLIVGDADGEEAGYLENTTPAMSAPTFAAPVGLGIGSEQNDVLSVDLNLDFDSDLVTANADGTISVLRGLGDGTYIGAVDYPVGEAALSVDAVDLNVDGLPDLAVLARDASGDTVLVEMINTTIPGSTTITFSVQEPISVDQGATEVVGGDLDGDGVPDIVTANGAERGNEEDVSVLLNEVEELIEGDIDGSGALDFGDLMILLFQYGMTGNGLAGDLDDSGDVGFTDLNQMLTLFRAMDPEPQR